MRDGSGRRPMIGVIGGSGAAKGAEVWRVAEQLGRRLVESGFRIACGGLGGVMEAACSGAHDAENDFEGCTVGILPGARRSSANRFVDIVVPTDLSHARNAVVVQADAVAAVGGGAGTLSEMAFAWLRDRLVVALEVEGWSGRLAGVRLDDRSRQPAPPDDRIFGAADSREAVEIIEERLPEYGGVP